MALLVVFGKNLWEPNMIDWNSWNFKIVYLKALAVPNFFILSWAFFILNQLILLIGAIFKDVTIVLFE